MPLEDPTKPWVIVPLHLGGTAPPTKAQITISDLFKRGTYGGLSLADYWSDQTLGAVDISGSLVLQWQPSDWNIRSYPGRLTRFKRHELVDQAKRHIPDQTALKRGYYRGVIAVFNFACNAGSSGRDVVWGIDGYGSTPTWGTSGWLFCTKCKGIVSESKASGPCSAGDVHALEDAPDPRPRRPPLDVSLRLTGKLRYITVSDQTVPQVRELHSCDKCGLLYAPDIPRARSRLRLGTINGALIDVPECPKGGGHIRLATTYALSRWEDPPGNRNFGTCRRCRLVLHDDADRADCPASVSGHKLEKTILAFPQLQPRLKGGRGYLAHEVAHGYGFNHGRGIEPRSHDLANDSWPGAYGDPSDMMSYGNVQAYEPGPGDSDELLGRRGPGLAVHHLLANGLIDPDHVAYSTPTGAPQFVTLRPVHRVRLAGRAALHFDGYVAEFRPRDYRWNAGLDTGPPALQTARGAPPRDGRAGRLVPLLDQAPGLVRIYHSPRSASHPDGVRSIVGISGWLSEDHEETTRDYEDLHVLVPSTEGRPYLGEGDVFESRLGLGTTRLTVEGITSAGAQVRLDSIAEAPGTRRFQRWLVLPCRHADSTGAFDLSKVRSLVAGVEDYWNSMAEQFFDIRGAYVLAAGEDPGGDDAVRLPWNASQDSDMKAMQRIRRIVDAALSCPNPLTPDSPDRLWMDWRWFTGIIVLKADGGGGVKSRGTMLLPAGRLPSGSPGGGLVEELPYDVIELSVRGLSHANLSRAIGRTLGVSDRADDLYDLMGLTTSLSRARRSGPLAYTAPTSGTSFGSSEWGAIGPGICSSSLVGRGWLDDRMIRRVRGGTGIVELTPLHRSGTGRGGIVRAEIGPYSFELRVPAGWDSGIPNPVVLARDSDGPPTALAEGDHIGWGVGVIEVSGGGRVAVVGLTPERATLSYYVRDRPMFFGGGARLEDGRVVVIGSGGKTYEVALEDDVGLRTGELIVELEKIAGQLENP